MLSRLYGVNNYEITSSPQEADIIIVSYLGDEFMDKAKLDSLLASHKVLFASDNFGYFPHYNLMSLGAWILQKNGLQHHLSNKGNMFKLPSQVYILQGQ